MLYKDADRFVEFVDSWKCSHDESSQCAIQLTRDLALNGFWSNRDVEVAQFWIDDLVTLGYRSQLLYFLMNHLALCLPCELNYY